MATKVNPYKLVNVTGASGKATPAVLAARKGIYAKNRLGLAAFSAGSLAGSLRDIAISNVKLDVLEKRLARRKSQRERDQEAEDFAEMQKLTDDKKGKVRKPTKKEKNKFGKIFGWMGELWGPIAQFIVRLLSFYVIQDLLKWVGDPANKEKLQVFVEKFVFVVQKLFDFAKWIIGDNILDGLTGLISGKDENGDPIGFIGQVKNLGKLLFGFISLRYLLNPFALIGDIVGLLDFIMNWRVPDFGWGRQKGPNRIRGPKGKNKIKFKKKQSKWWEFFRKKKTSVTRAADSYRRFIKGTSNFGDRLRLLRRGQIGLRGLFKKGARGDDLLKAKQWKIPKGIREFPGKAKDWFGAKTKPIINSFRTKIDDLKIGEKLRKLPGQIGDGIKSNIGKTWKNIKGLKDSKVVKGALELGTEISKRARGMFNTAVRNTGRGARAFGGWAGRNLKRIYHLPGKIEKGLKSKIFGPIYKKFIKPVIGAVGSAGNKLLGAINKVPFIRKMTEALGKRGITWGSFGKFTGRWGRRLNAALPFIGGLGNFYFSKVAFDGGDNIGGILEGIAGALTIGGGISTATGVGATWGGPMIALGTALDAYLLARILPGIGPAILQWEQDGGLMQIIPGLTGLVDRMTGQIGPSAQKKSKEVDKILAGKDDDDKVDASGSGILGTISSDATDMVNADKEIKKQQEKKKRAWWDFLGWAGTGKEDDPEKKVETATPQKVSSSSKVSSRFDVKTGKGYINGKEVSMDEYTKYHNMSMQEKLRRYGNGKDGGSDDDKKEEKKKPWWKFWGGGNKETKSKGSSSGILGTISSDVDDMVNMPKKKETKKPWWKFWGGNKQTGGSLSSGGKGQTISGYGKVPKANWFKGIIDFVTKPVKWLADGVSTVAGWIGDGIEGLGNIANDIMNSQLGQVLSIALPIIFPQYKWIQTLISGMNAFRALSNGNPIAAVISLWNTGANIFPETFANMSNKVTTWFDNNIGSKFSNIWEKGKSIYDGFMETKVGKVSAALIQGNWGGALGAAIEGTGFEQGLAAFGAQIDAAGLSGVLGMVPGVTSAIANIPGLDTLPGVNSLVSGGFSPAAFVSGMAEKHGMGSIYKAMMGVVDGGDMASGLRELAPELGVDKRVLGVVDQVGEVFRDGKIDTEYALQTALEMIPIPIIVEKLQATPVPVDSSSGVGEQLSTAGGMRGLLNRMAGGFG